MIRERGQGKPLRWVIIVLGVVFGGYLLVTLLGAVFGLAFAAGTIFGGAWLLHRLWNSWKTQKKDQSGLISDPPVQSIDEDLEKLKAKVNQKSDEC
ncbi:MAG: hypothetical protein VX399_08400 [SAR324 cluster bacterium]|nr:hypothetical protein [SAR324 cluster bacterium]